MPIALVDKKKTKKINRILLGGRVKNGSLG